MIRTTIERPVSVEYPPNAFGAEQFKMLENAVSELEYVDYALLQEEMAAIQRSVPAFDVNVIFPCTSSCVVK
jgi:hypothetical protein